MRNLLSYYGIQKLISSIIRNKAFLNSFTPKNYLDVGCGNNFNFDFVHLDYHWMPGVDVCWDFSRKALPLENSSFDGIFTEHCLEHIPYHSVAFVLKEFYRVLKRGGVLRIIVPDGELYLSEFVRIKRGENVLLPYQRPDDPPMVRINGLFRNHGHQFIYDFETFRLLLEDAGFGSVERKSFREGRDSKLLKDLEWRKIESLYLEAYEI